MHVAPPRHLALSHITNALANVYHNVDGEVLPVSDRGTAPRPPIPAPGERTFFREQQQDEGAGDKQLAGDRRRYALRDEPSQQSRGENRGAPRLRSRENLSKGASGRTRERESMQQMQPFNR